MESGRWLQVNVVGLAAAGLGILCLVLPAVIYTVDLSYNNPSYLEDGQGYRIGVHLTDIWTGLDNVRLVLTPLAPAMFLLGIVLAFVSPLGGIVMAAGMLDFYLETHGYIGEWIYKHPTVTYAWGPAFYVGIAASVIGVASFAYPVRVCFSGAGVCWTAGRKSILNRILVWDREPL